MMRYGMSLGAMHHSSSELTEVHFTTWWRIETFSALLAISAGNSPVTGELPVQRPVTRSFDVFFDLSLNKRLSIQSWGCILSRPLCRHYSDQLNGYTSIRIKVWVSNYTHVKVGCNSSWIYIAVALYKLQEYGFLHSMLLEVNHGDILLT